MAPDRIEIELTAMRKSINRKMTWMIVTCFAVLIFLVGAWSRSEVKLANQQEDIEAYRKAALNKQAFFSHISADKLRQESIEMLITDPNSKAAVDHFNKGWIDIHDEIFSTQTEIVPRGATFGNSPNQKMSK